MPAFKCSGIVCVLNKMALKCARNYTNLFRFFKDVGIWLPSVLWHCWLGGRKGIRPVKNWVVGCWRGCLRWSADLHIAQQMPLPLTISCSSKSRLVLLFLVLPFWYLLTRVDPDKFQKSSKTIVCVCVWAFGCLPRWWIPWMLAVVWQLVRFVIRNAVCEQRLMWEPGSSSISQAVGRWCCPTVSRLSWTRRHRWLLMRGQRGSRPGAALCSQQLQADVPALMSHQVGVACL